MKKIDSKAYLASTSVLTSEVEVAEGASIWYGVVLRGDRGKIYIGKNSNIQDNVVLHGDQGKGVKIGENVTVGHGAIIHAADVENNCLIGINATVLSRAVIGSFSIIGAGALIPPNKKIPPQSVVMGVPGKIVRKITSEEKEYLKEHPLTYRKLAEKEL